MTPESQIQITLSTSRPQITAGAQLGITADIKNRSGASVYLVPKYVTMTPPPEINLGSPVAGWYATIQAPGTKPPSQEDPDSTNQYDRVVELAPGDTASAVWVPREDVSRSPWKRLSNNFWEVLNLLDFSPGEYRVKGDVLYWPDQKSAESLQADYRSEVAEAKVLVGAPQWVVLTGAIIGGIIAYFLLPNARLIPSKIEWKGILTSALVSGIVTILLSRLSETQFLIRVTINDLWGAIAVGFIASSSGTSILQKHFSPDVVASAGSPAQPKATVEAPPPRSPSDQR